MALEQNVGNTSNSIAPYVSCHETTTLEQAPLREGCMSCARQVASCIMRAPLQWLRFGCCFPMRCCPPACVLCCSHRGDTRFQAVVEIIRLAASLGPRNVLALQALTDVAATLPGFRRGRMMLFGYGIQCCDAVEVRGGGEWLWPSRYSKDYVFQEDGLLILYIHGGAFSMCSAATHRGMTFNLFSAIDACSGEDATTLLLAANYRRPGDEGGQFPVALNDVYEVYMQVEKMFPKKQIVVAGESAGGNLAIGLCLKLYKETKSKPHHLIVISPWVDLSQDARKNLEPKDYLPPDLIDPLAEAYAGIHWNEDLASPLKATDEDLRNSLPRILIICGESEILFPQQQEFIEKLKLAKVDFGEYLAPGMPHAFPMFVDIAYWRAGARSFAVICAVIAFLIVWSVLLRHRGHELKSILLMVVSVVFALVCVCCCLAWKRQVYMRRCEHRRSLYRLRADNASELPAPQEAFRRIGQFLARSR